MEIVKNPAPKDVLPLFRALHLFHVGIAPQVYHADGSDAEYLGHLEEAYAAGAALYAVEVSWGYVAYLLALPEHRKADGLLRGYNRMRIDHLYVAPTHRGRALGRRLVTAMERDMASQGLKDWVVTWHADNPEAGQAYARLGARQSIVKSHKSTAH